MKIEITIKREIEITPEQLGDLIEAARTAMLFTGRLSCMPLQMADGSYGYRDVKLRHDSDSGSAPAYEALKAALGAVGFLP